MLHFFHPKRKPSEAFDQKRVPGKLQNKLFRYYLIMPSMILIAFFIFFYSYVSSILIQRELSSLQTQVESIRTSVYNELYDLDQVSVNINFFNRKTSFFTSTSLSSNPLNEYIAALNGTDLKADQINLYNLNHTVAEIGRVTRTTSYDPDTLDWFDAVLQNGGVKTVSTPYQTKRYSPNSQSKEWYVSVYRAATDHHRQVIGAIETIRRCKNLFRDIARYTQKTQNPARVYIFNETGDLIYPYDLSEEEHQTLQVYYDLLLDLKESGAKCPSSKIQDPLTGNACRYILESSEFSGWNYFFLQEDRVILKPVHDMLVILFSILLIMLLVSIFFSWILARNIVQPVKHLKHVIQRVRLDTLGVERVNDYHVSYEELNELYEEFEKMNHTLKDSLEELEHTRNLELKSRVLALQTQMNPHFYYNTLSCISILAENGQTEEVSNLCQNLSTIMRYITNTEDTVVPISDTIDYIHRYLYCMKIRYEDSLNYEVHIDPELLSHPVPKLILQPLIENAIKYGTNCLPPWTLHIEGILTEKEWTITVTDSGEGFSPEALQELRSRLNQLDLQGKDADIRMKIGGLGLVNTYIRWKLYCREDAIFEFGNTPEGHAYTRIGRKLHKTSDKPTPSQHI